MGKMIPESAAIKRKAAAYNAYGAQAAKQPGWGGMGSKPTGNTATARGTGAKRLFKKAPKY